jgi:RNA polymerase sigma factor (sigma-70 family)
MYLTSDEINVIANKFVELRDGIDKKAFEQYQKYCIKKLSPLVNNKIRKYRKFSNYPDLQQDGFEALMLAFETYEPEKGCFSWWANKYIETRISRQANAHSTIRVPIKKAKEFPPYKTNTIPVMVDLNNPCENIEDEQNKEVVKLAIDQLSERHKQVILMHYGFNDQNSAISNISKELNISRPACIRLLGEAEKSLKNKLQRYFG